MKGLELRELPIFKKYLVPGSTEAKMRRLFLLFSTLIAGSKCSKARVKTGGIRHLVLGVWMLSPFMLYTSFL